MRKKIDLNSIQSVSFQIGSCFEIDSCTKIGFDEHNQLSYLETEPFKLLPMICSLDKVETAWEELKHIIEMLNIHAWKKYYDSNGCDGTQWKLVISFRDRKSIEIGGSNEYPPNFSILKNAFSKIHGY